jgi:hypothetical protein
MHEMESYNKGIMHQLAIKVMSNYLWCKHMANSMIGGVSDSNVWYVDSRASNHMTSHGEWFRDTKDLKTPGFVESDDDTHTNW